MDSRNEMQIQYGGFIPGFNYKHSCSEMVYYQAKVNTIMNIKF